MGVEMPTTARVFGLAVATVLLCVGLGLLWAAPSAAAELRRGILWVGGGCAACALVVFATKSSVISSGVALIGAAILGAFVFFFVVLLGGR